MNTALTKTGQVPKPVLYITMGIMVYMTIYTLGVRISIFTTAFDLLHEKVPTLYWYGILIRSCGLLSLLLLFVARKKLLRFETILLAVLLVWMAFCAFLNRDTGLKDNLHGVITISATVVAFYLIGRYFSRDDIRFVLRRMILWGTVVWNVGCVISLGMYFANYRGYYMFGGFIRRSRQGLMDGRLFGCFSDPNYAAMISLLLIGGLVYFYRRNTASFRSVGTPKKGEKILYHLIRVYMVISMVLPALYIVLSGSRSTEVAGILGVIVLVILVTYRQRKREAVTGGRIRDYGVRLLLTIAAILAMYFASLYAMQGIGAIVSPERDTKVELERNDVDMENISNSRFRIWGDYLTLWKDQPVYGFSTVGALRHAEELDSESYLSTKKYNPHSMFVQMLVQTGAVGFLLMMVFWIRALIRVWKRCLRKKELSNLFLISLFWVIVHGVFCVFNVGIFITPCLEAALVWVGLGYMEQSCEREAGGGEG